MESGKGVVRVNISIRELKYIHARISAYADRLSRIEELLNIPPVEKGVKRARKRPHESIERSPSLNSDAIKQDVEPVTGAVVT